MSTAPQKVAQLYAAVGNAVITAESVSKGQTTGSAVYLIYPTPEERDVALAALQELRWHSS